jgi:nucleotide-binding universal stress UspA family protein
VHSAEGIAQRAAATLQQAFPGWQVQTVAASGSACGILLEQTDEWRPALLVVGSHGHSMLRRVFVGSVSLKMAMEAPCSVRVARGRAKTNGGPLRLLIGVDGSPGAEATVGAVAARRWPPGTEARVVNAVWKIPAAAAQQVEFHELPTQQLVEQVAAENERLHEKVAYSVSKLQAAGLVTSSVMQEADPKRLLLDEAERWQADCIFVGASGHSRFQRLWLGSVSTAVVTRAACSVEIVR